MLTGRVSPIERLRVRAGGAALALCLTPTLVAPGVRVKARSVSACRSANSGATRSETLRSDGLERNYLVHVSPHRAETRLPLVFAFHGRGETPELLAKYSKLSRLDAIVVYPRGLPGRGGKLSWSGTPTAASGANDIHFVLAIIARLRATGCADPSRVYATGKSDGGSLAADLACEAADAVTAVAPVAGAYYPIAGGCSPSRPVAIAEFHGNGDRVVPYAGSARRGLPSIAQWLGAWAVRDGCTRRDAPRTVAPGISQRRWTGCRARSTVEGYRISGGGHTWPGSHEPSGPGTTTQAIDATAIVARFFGLSENTND